MNILTQLRKLIGLKQSEARIITTYTQLGQPQSTPANYEAFADKGYSKNSAVYTAINKITTACKGIEWELYTRNGKSLTEAPDTHPLYKLLYKPNPMQDLASFIESIVGFEMIAGNSYIEANNGDSPGVISKKPPIELWPVRPDKMKIIPGSLGYPLFFEFGYSGRTFRWPVDQVTLKSKIAHWKTFNPTNDWYGLAPLQAALLQLDQNNSAQRWNLALLQNSATPSGVLQMQVSDANPRGELTEEQYARLKSEFDSNYTGARNAGRPMIIEGGLKWQSISLSPKDMDFLKGKEVTTTDIFLIFGIPPELVGLGQKTFSNYKEARLAFYEETILPTMDALRGLLNNWLCPMFGDNLYLDYDKDDIEALTVRRESKYAALQPVTFLTPNEKREQVGYEDIEGGDQLQSTGTPNAQGDNSNAGNQANDGSNNSTVEGQKPTADENAGDDQNPQDESTDEGKSDSETEWKTINLLNANEKRRSWARQNRRRKSLENSFYRDLKSDYDDLTNRLSALAKRLESRDQRLTEFALQKEASDFSKELGKTLSRHIRYTLDDFGKMIFGEAKSLNLGHEHKANLKYDSFIEEYIKRHTATQIKTITSTNERTIRRIVSEWVQEGITEGDTLPDLSKFIEAEFSDLTPGMARRIARTEVSMASNNGSLEAIKSLQVPGIFKEWVTAQDDRVRDGEHGGADHAAADGQEVPLDEKFLVPPDASMDGPGDIGAEADQVINCRCVLVYKQKGNSGE